jgi:hypothetical protein
MVVVIVVVIPVALAAVSLVVMPVAVHFIHPLVSILVLTAELSQQVVVITLPLSRIASSFTAVVRQPPAALHFQ